MSRLHSWISKSAMIYMWDNIVIYQKILGKTVMQVSQVFVCPEASTWFLALKCLWLLYKHIQTPSCHVKCFVKSTLSSPNEIYIFLVVLFIFCHIVSANSALFTFLVYWLKLSVTILRENFMFLFYWEMHCNKLSRNNIIAI